MNWVVDMPTLSPTQSAALVGLLTGLAIYGVALDWWSRKRRLEDTPVWVLEELHDTIEGMIRQKRDAWDEVKAMEDDEFLSLCADREQKEERLLRVARDLKEREDRVRHDRQQAELELRKLRQQRTLDEQAEAMP